MTTSRRGLLKRVGSVGAAGLFGGNSLSVRASSTKQVESAVISSTGFELGSIPHAVAVREWLSQATDGEYTAELKNLTSTTLQMQALLSGDIDVYTSSLGALYRANAAGHEFRIIGTKVAGTDYVIALREDVPGLSAFEGSDLKMGISSIGALSHVQTTGMLLHNDVDPDRVNFVKIGSSSNRTAALAAGRIAGAPLHQSQLRKLQNEDVAVKNGGTVREVYPDYLENTIAVRADWIEAKGTDGFLRAYLEQVLRANERATTDFDWLYEKAEEYQAETLPKEDLRKEWEIATEIDRWPYEEFSKQGYESVLSMMDGAGLVDANDVDLDSMYHPIVFDDVTGN